MRIALISREHPSKTSGGGIGTYTMTMTDSKTKKVMNDHGSYVTDYRKQPDGSWKAVADIVTSEVPMAPAAPMKMKH